MIKECNSNACEWSEHWTEHHDKYLGDYTSLGEGSFNTLKEAKEKLF